MVYLVFSVTGVTSFYIVGGLLAPSVAWVIEFEVPQEVVCLLEVWPNCVDFMNQIFHTNDIVLLQTFLDHTVGRQWNSLAIDTAKTSLVNELPDGLQTGVAPCNVRLSNAEHIDCRLI